MMSTRAVGLAPAFRQVFVAPRFARNQITRNVLVKRSVQTQSLPPSAAKTILNEQRLKRPSSPHFTIYQPQLTWVASIANRVAGSGLSALLYAYAIAYLVAPDVFDSTHVIEFIGGMPEYVKLAGKTILAGPFAFHSLNGLRHLAWDGGKLLTLKGAYTSGYIVIGASVLATVGLVLL